MDPNQKNAVVKRIRERMMGWYKGPNIQAACLYWAAMAVTELTKRGVRTILQAGTSMWPCVAEDDGVSPTHFSYCWDPRSAETHARLNEGLLPEMHVWAAIPSRGEIIDLTTRYLIAQARDRAGLTWCGPVPPDYLWANATELPDGVVYRPDRAATFIAHELLSHTARAAGRAPTPGSVRVSLESARVIRINRSGSEPG
jgi:hypothetical protein